MDNAKLRKLAPEGLESDVDDIFGDLLKMMVHFLPAISILQARRGRRRAPRMRRRKKLSLRLDVLIMRYRRSLFRRSPRSLRRPSIRRDVGSGQYAVRPSRLLAFGARRASAIDALDLGPPAGSEKRGQRPLHRIRSIAAGEAGDQWGTYRQNSQERLERMFSDVTYLVGSGTKTERNGNERFGLRIQFFGRAPGPALSLWIWNRWILVESLLLVPDPLR